MEERIASPRGRVLLAGKILFNAGRSSIDCTVRNLFDGGAYLESQSPVGIPQSFDLVIAGNEVRPCKLEWQTAQRLGVSFVKADERANGPRATAPDKSNVPLRGELFALRSALDRVD